MKRQRSDSGSSASGSGSSGSSDRHKRKSKHLEGSYLIGGSSILGCSLLLIEMNLDQYAVCCVNSVNDTKLCNGVVQERGLSSLVVSSKGHDPTTC